MDEFGRVSFQEASDAISSFMYVYNLYETISVLSSKEFAKKVLEVISAEKNNYGLDKQYQRMNNTIELLKHGVAQDDLLQLLNTQTEGIAIGLIDLK